MTELTPFFETLRKVCMVLSLAGAVEFLALVVIFLLMVYESRIRNRKKRRADK